LLCLGFIALIKLIVETQIKTTGINLRVDLPILFNIPIYSKFQYVEKTLKISNCEEVFLKLKFKNSGTYINLGTKSIGHFLEKMMEALQMITLLEKLVGCLRDKGA
jgi:hypothetical protein